MVKHSFSPLPNAYVYNSIYTVYSVLLEKKVEAKARPVLDANTLMFSLMVIGSLNKLVRVS